MKSVFICVHLRFSFYLGFGGVAVRVKIEQNYGVLFQQVLEKYPDQGASVYSEAG